MVFLRLDLFSIRLKHNAVHHHLLVVLLLRLTHHLEVWSDLTRELAVAFVLRVARLQIILQPIKVIVVVEVRALVCDLMERCGVVVPWREPYLCLTQHVGPHVLQVPIDVVQESLRNLLGVRFFDRCVPCVVQLYS